MTLKDDLRKASMESAAETDALLLNEYTALIKLTSADFDKLRPQINDQDLYDKLISAVEEATNNNLALAEFQKRLETLGEGAVQLGKDIIKLI